ncbi:unnamed protein product, partial [Chrysoparadoxa australica]
RSDWIPPYNEDGIRNVLLEMRALYGELDASLNAGTEMKDIPNSVKVGVVVHHEALLRNKRCLMAYVKTRMDKISGLRWEAGSVIPADLQRSMSVQEVEYFNRYNRYLTEYQQAFGLDLTADMQPPKEMSVEVRVLEDCGEVMTDAGPVRLKKGQTHFLRRSDADSMVRQGLLQHLENEITA